MMRFWSARPIRLVLSNSRASRAISPIRTVALADEVFADLLFPDVRLVALLLLGLDVLALEILVRPPRLAFAEELDGLGEKLVAIAGKFVDLDGADLDRPEAPPAGLVAQVGGLVRGADEDALARLDHLLAAVARPVAFGRAGDEGLEQRGLGAAHGVHLGDLDQPLAAQVLRDVLAFADVGQAIARTTGRRARRRRCF